MFHYYYYYYYYVIHETCTREMKCIYMCVCIARRLFNEILSTEE